VALPEGGGEAAAIDAFHNEHERLYAHSDRRTPVQFVGLRVRIIGRLPNPDGAVASNHERVAELPVKERRRLSFEGQMVENVPVHLRRDLAGGVTVTGPAVIEQDDTTILLPPLFRANAGPTGELVLRRG